MSYLTPRDIATSSRSTCCMFNQSTSGSVTAVAVTLLTSIDNKPSHKMYSMHPNYVDLCNYM